MNWIGRLKLHEIPRAIDTESASGKVAAVAEVAARDQDGVARKWRRNGLKRLNPRPEMVWARGPRTYKIWYAGPRLTISGSGSGAARMTKLESCKKRRLTF